MIKFDFNQSVGLPLETNLLDEMQQSWSIFNSLGSLVGDLSIISGCIVTGTTVSDGVVFINNELLPFKGGAVQSKVIISETKTALEFEDGNAHDVITKRIATFGVATTSWNWSDFKRGFETKLIQGELDKKEDKTTITALLARITALEARPASNIPIGMIAIWGQPVASIPSGWSPYEPLKGRIPIGLDTSTPPFDTLLGYGGSQKHTMTIAEMPPHTHDIQGSNDDNGGQGDFCNTSPNQQNLGTKTKSAGSGQAFDIMNPYRVVHFIIYTG
ncbi:hypothetical protein [uncultured Flavobacterium sp.]|uniref:phage baseplate protein n=1 Tax=uncultured Flavobacterium sp. TaxID=165435 RepID=UPI0025FA6BC1|nr:hypothetical protein [uncultured Flavobacterium sp.]